VSQIVQDTKGAIGYIDYSDAVATELRFAAIANRTGAFVAPTLAAVSAAAAKATIKDDLSYDPLWADGAEVYPIAAPTWILVYLNQPDPSKAALLRAYLQFILTTGQELADSVDYAPIPAPLAQRALAQLDRISST
jgi:phosphate transport system substrate-binding protein